jgi:hypothetical protein
VNRSQSAQGRRCANCGTALAGAWCHACGQREIEPEARRMRVLMGDLFEALTDLDGRFWRSLRALLLQPGRLSRDWLDGRRQGWMPPMALFLLAALLYFVAPGLTDFQLPFIDHANGRLRVQMLEPSDVRSPEQLARISSHSGQPHSAWTAAWVEHKLAARQRALQQQDPSSDYSIRELAQDYDRRAGELSKLLVIIHVPLIAAALALLLWRRRLLFADHFVVAVHLFSFLLIVIQLMPLLLQIVGFALGERAAAWAMSAFAALLVAYFWAALRRVYALGPVQAVLPTLLLLVLLYAGSVYVFRTVQFLLILALI